MWLVKRGLHEPGSTRKHAEGFGVGEANVTDLANREADGLVPGRRRRRGPACRVAYGRGQERALAVARSLAFCRAWTSSPLLIRDRPGTSIRLARSYRCSLEAFASTPPADGSDV